jgi:hypothetical protein
MSRHFTPSANVRLVTACTGVAIALTLATAAFAWSASRPMNAVSIASPVALPGVVLAPGAYVFEIVADAASGDVVRVSTSGGQARYMGLTIPIARPRDLPKNQAIVLGEAPAGEPQPIRAWFPTNGGAGREFLYR